MVPLLLTGIFLLGSGGIKMNIAERIMSTRFWKLLVDIQQLLMVISTAGVVLTLGIVVVCRHLHINFLGYNEIIMVGAFWMYFSGASYGTYEESHIVAEILSQFVSDRTRMHLAIFSKVVQFLLGIPLIALAYGMVSFDILTNQATVDLKIPLIIPHVIVFISYVLMTFYAFVYLVRDIFRLRDVNYAPK